MREQFANEVALRLVGRISDEDVRLVKETILASLSNYEIVTRETAISLYENFVPDFYKIYLLTMKMAGRSPGTMRTYNHYLMDFFINLKCPIKEVTTADIYEYLYKRQARGTVSNRTLDHIRIILHAFFEWCCDEYYIQRNPCKSVKPIKYTQKLRVPLTDIELEVVRENCSNLYESAMVEFLYSSGCRITELTRLNRSDVNFQNRSVVLFGKGDKYRVSFINARAELLLRRYLATRDDEDPALFVTQRRPQHRITKVGAEALIKKIGIRAGLDRPLTPHIFRHTFATNLVRRGARLEDVQQLLGHDKPSTTMIYTKIDTEAIRREHERYII